MGTTVGMQQVDGHTPEWQRFYDLAMAAQPRGVSRNAGYLPWGEGDGRGTGYEVGDQAAAMALGNAAVEAIRAIVTPLGRNDPVRAAGEREYSRFRSMADAYAQPVGVARVTPAAYANEICKTLGELRAAVRR